MRLRAVTGLLRKSESSTADAAAAIRALHQRRRSRVFDDRYARVLCGGFWRLVLALRPLEWILARLTRPTAPVAMCVLMRARYAERVLERAVERGVVQYVIIGAGMDSFAFRRGDLSARIDVFEVDHPATQSKKRDRIRRAGLKVPPRLHFVAADLEKTALLDALSGSGFDASRPTLLTLLGVTYYLTDESLAETAGSIARGLSPGTLLVIDYLLDAASSRPEHLPMRDELKAFVARMGEPMISDGSQAAMNTRMEALGFDTVENVALPELEPQLLEELGELPLEVPSFFGLAVFKVADPDERSARTS